MLRITNIILSILAIVLIFFLWKSIMSPIKFQKSIEDRNVEVHDKLYEIKTAQNAFKDVTEYYANDFDTLTKVLLKDSFRIKNPVTEKILVISILDSLYDGDASIVKDLALVPNGNGDKFIMGAGVLDSKSDSTVKIPVFEAYTLTDNFLGGDKNGLNKNYWKPGKKVRMGSLTAPITNGNWER